MFFKQVSVVKFSCWRQMQLFFVCVHWCCFISMFPILVSDLSSLSAYFTLWTALDLINHTCCLQSLVTDSQCANITFRCIYLTDRGCAARDLRYAAMSSMPRPGTWRRPFPSGSSEEGEWLHCLHTFLTPQFKKSVDVLRWSWKLSCHLKTTGNVLELSG